MQDHVATLGAEVRPDGLQKRRRILADVEVRGVAAVNLALVELDVIGFLIGFANGDVAHLLKAEVDRIAFPNCHAFPQNRVQRPRHVKIADAAAGQPRCSGPRTLLVDQHDFGPLALAGLFQSQRQMPRGGHAMHPGTDHHKPRTFRQRRGIKDGNDGGIFGRLAVSRRQGTVLKRVPLVVLSRVRCGGHCDL